MIERIVEITGLFDFYGNILSDIQRNVIDMYYIEDLSLSEIAENLEISRQGVYDALKRGEKKLLNYEKNLKLYEKFQLKLKDIEMITNYCKEFRENNQKIIQDNTEVKELIDNITTAINIMSGE